MSGPDGPRPHPTEQLDPGLQSERTYLAWQRTGLGFAGVGALLLHNAFDGHFVLVIPGLLALLAAALLTTRAQLRYRATVAAVHLGRSPADRRVVAATAVLTTVLCLTGLAVILLL
ncbi:MULTISPECIES: DUF202 domain-containing protein [unclassified Pseudofrankia]|uniref:DUF202 domain-containing protein n=1 Tax=unclassified Pseudofrankia TaxID=2994372 RepID=UPI0008D93FC6|nr:MULTISPECIES: DUF202 domain-containing protein [unclassified Pseudofrankia]MDT3442795.1 DUF202 domain-containing protein [Pseudofrankia sp. BMG5.37]OHV44241.1 hypothetical protein BCD48_26110 [Pseudofrankia sp. BMG5.36]